MPKSKAPRQSNQGSGRDPAAVIAPTQSAETAEALRARIATDPVVRGVLTGNQYAQPVFGGDVDMIAYKAQLHQQAKKVMAGDMSGVETMLVVQANTLDMLFNQLASRAASSEYLNHMDVYLRQALKAQAQCRATLEALAEIKNPRPVAFVKQANIAHGPQQVNNGASPSAHAHEKDLSQSNQLLEVSHEQRLDTGTAGTAGRGDQAMEAVGAVNRADER